MHLHATTFQQHLQISQWIWCSRECGSYHVYQKSGLQLSRKLQNQGLRWIHHFESCTVANIIWLTVGVTNDHRSAKCVVITLRSCPHQLLITGCVRRVTRRVPQLDQEPCILQDDVPLLSDFSGCSFCSICSFLITVSSFLHCIFCPAINVSDYPFHISKRFFTLKSGGKRESLKSNSMNMSYKLSKKLRVTITRIFKLFFNCVF